MNSLTIKRLEKEYKLILDDPPELFVTYPLKNDMFTWHFTILGPKDSPYQNGLFHGKIKLPLTYPLEPPNIQFLTPNGRFEINKDICLTVTGHHKETWVPIWTIRTIIEAMIAYIPVDENYTAIGSLKMSNTSRIRLAVESQNYCCELCGPIKTSFFEKKIKIISGKKDEEEKLNDKKDNFQNIVEENEEQNIKRGWNFFSFFTTLFTKK